MTIIDTSSYFSIVIENQMTPHAASILQQSFIHVGFWGVNNLIWYRSEEQNIDPGVEISTTYSHHIWLVGDGPCMFISSLAYCQNYMGTCWSPFILHIDKLGMRSCIDISDGETLGQWIDCMPRYVYYLHWPYSYIKVVFSITRSLLLIYINSNSNHKLLFLKFYT